MKKWLFAILMLVETCNLSAQNIVLYGISSIDTAELAWQNGRLADSTKRRILFSQEDSDRVWQYFLLSEQNTFNNADKAIFYANKGLNIAEKIHFDAGYFYCIKVNSWNLMFSGNYTRSLALEFNALQKLEKTDNYYRLALTLHDIGYAYLVAHDARTALKFIYEAWETIQPHFLDFPLVAQTILLNTGEAYDSLNQLDSALLFIQKSYDLNVHIQGSLGSAALREMANVYSKKGDLDTAMVFYRRALYTAKYLIDIVSTYNGMADNFKKIGRTDSAIFYAKRSISEGKDFPGNLILAYNILAQLYKEENAIDSAFKYQQLSFNLRDSVFNIEKLKQLQTFSFNEQQHQQELRQQLARANLVYKNRLNVYFLLGGLVILAIVAGGLWRRNVYKQRSYLLLQKQKQEIDFQKSKVEQTLEDLKTTQTQLIQSEKMASLGELTAGIAHEIQNPLNFVNNFSEVNKEMIAEMKEEIGKGNYEEVKLIANNIEENEEKINHHGKRADAIVKGMLQHSRTGSGIKEPTDINRLADEYLRLAYQGFRARDKTFNAKFETKFDETIGEVIIVPQDIGRVILNLINNAFYAVSEKAKQNIAGYESTVTVSTKKMSDKIELRVADNGNGIPQSLRSKIFQPFFTTKPTGQGTGLGLSLAYDIVKAHGGEIKVNTNEGEGSEFIIELPVNN